MRRTKIKAFPWCVRHAQRCRLQSADVVILGSPCTDFSSYGKHLGMQGPTIPCTLAAFRRAQGAAMIVHENVTRFPKALFESAFTDYNIYTIRASPKDVGWPGLSLAFKFTKRNECARKMTVKQPDTKTSKQTNKHTSGQTSSLTTKQCNLSALRRFPYDQAAAGVSRSRAQSAAAAWQPRADVRAGLQPPEAILLLAAGLALDAGSARSSGARTVDRKTAELLQGQSVKRTANKQTTTTNA
jgi:hypothetical protein